MMPLFFLFIFCLFVIFRLIYLLFVKRGKGLKQTGNAPVKTLIIIGSGGHTSEMLRLISELNSQLYSPRIYILAQSDTSSEVKVHGIETPSTDYKVVRIPRSRSVNQSYASSILTTLYSTLYSIPLILKYRPSLILCNGPGTCIPICVIVFVFNIFYWNPACIVFIESICRVETLSLTGKILYWFADSIIVQWPQLAKKYKRSIYLGRLV